MEKRRNLPGLTREAEEQNLQEIIQIAQNNLDHAKADIRKLNADLEDLLDVYDAQDKEGLALWNNATVRLHENEHNLVRYEKARKKPYFGRIDFKDPNAKEAESYYIGRVGIARDVSEPVVLDWRAPIASVYYESSLGPCQYVVSSEGTFTIDLKRKRTYEIENDHLKDFFDSDVVANDELLTKYLAEKQKSSAWGDRCDDPERAKPDHPAFSQDQYHCAGSSRFRKDNSCHAPDFLYSIQLQRRFPTGRLLYYRKQPDFAELYHRRASGTGCVWYSADDHGTVVYPSVVRGLG